MKDANNPKMEIVAAIAVRPSDNPLLKIIADGILDLLQLTLPNPHEGLIAILLVKQSIEESLGIDGSSIERLPSSSSSTPHQPPDSNSN